MADPDLTRKVRRYWNERIHDLEMTTQPVGSREFFRDLDAYRFDKLAYLPTVVDFSGFRDKRVIEVGCGIATDLVRFGRGGARVAGIDLSETAIGWRSRTSPRTDSEASCSSATAPRASVRGCHVRRVLRARRAPMRPDPRRIVESACAS